MIGAVFFDLGETLVNEAPMWEALAERAGIEPHVLMAGLGATIARGEQHWQAWDLIGVERPDDADGIGIPSAAVYADAAPCLRRLRADGLFVGVAGNVGGDLSSVVEHFGLEADYAVGSEALGADKPSPRFFERLLEAAGRPAAEVAYVGDRYDNDVVPATAAGMFAVHIRRGPWGYLQRGAGTQISSLDELPGVLAGA
jgi:FMN phosphatase YigB (HAD superfamily)